MKRNEFLWTLLGGTVLAKDSGGVSLERTPGGGIQPQAVLRDGILHLIYFSGDPGAGDVYYVNRPTGAAAFSHPVRVNSQAGSVIAIGTVRGPQMAAGRDGRVHVCWMGSKNAEPRGPGGATPMLYARSNGNSGGFEPQRTVMKVAPGLDGGGSVAADAAGNVYVAWHGKGDGDDESHRRVWIATSRDDGAHFATEEAASPEPTGACACCGMRILTGARGDMYVLYRAARENVHRDMYLLRSQDHGKTFQAIVLQGWDINACPMSTASIAEAGDRVLLAWETRRQVYYSWLDRDARMPVRPVAAPGAGPNRKHPALAANANGDVMLAWTEGTGWKKGGSIAWHVFDASGRPLKEAGRQPGLPAWSRPAAYAATGSRFTIVY